MKTYLIKKSFTTLSALILMTSCLNEADQLEAQKKSVKLNGDTVIQMMSVKHQDIASGVTAFWLPNSQGRPGVDLRDLPKAEQDEIKRVSRVIVDNGEEIARLTTEIKSPNTQCVNLLKAYIGMQRCEAGKPQMEAGYAQIAEKQAKLDAGFVRLEAKKAQADVGVVQKRAEMIEIETKLNILYENPSANAEEIAILEIAFAEAEKEYKNYIHLIAVTLPREEEQLSFQQAQLDAALADLDGNKHQCEVQLPGLWASLADFHTNLPECGQMKQKAEDLGAQIAQTVGLHNWMSTDPAQTKLKIVGDDVRELAVAIGPAGGAVAVYSIDKGNIFDVSFNGKTRQFKFKMMEEDVAGLLTGDILEVSAEKTAIDNVQKYVGHIKRMRGSEIIIQGKLSLTFDNE